jgi:predicted dehydrogenase
MRAEKSGAGLRYAILGTGLMGLEHIRNIALTGGAVLAIADPVESSRQWAMEQCAKLGLAAPLVHDCATDLTAAGGFDAVVVASPNHTHRAVLEPLFESGAAILCEKPLATTVADAQWIAGEVAKRATLFWTGMEYRFMPPAARFIADVHGGRVGRLAMLSIREHRFPFLHKVGDWNRFSANTGGTMVEKCCHFFDLMCAIIRAQPVRVYCSGALDVNHRGERYDGQVPDIIDNSYTVVDFDNGVRACLDLSMFAEGAEHQEELTAVGDEARLDALIPPGDLVFRPRAIWRKPELTVRERIDVPADILAAGSHFGATYHQHLAFQAAVRGDAPVAVTAEDGVRAVAMGVAAELSAREHRVVAMAEVLGTGMAEAA